LILQSLRLPSPLPYSLQSNHVPIPGRRGLRESFGRTEPCSIQCTCDRMSATRSG
jgi:hypothetical protein